MYGADEAMCRPVSFAQRAATIARMVEVRLEIAARNAKIDALREQALIERQRRRGLEYERDDERKTGFWNALEEERDLTFGDTLGNGYGTFTTWFNGATDSYVHAASVLTPAGLVAVGTYLSVVPGAPRSGARA